MLTKTLCFAARRGKLPRSLLRPLVRGDGRLSRRGGRDLREKKENAPPPQGRRTHEKIERKTISGRRASACSIFLRGGIKKNEPIFTNSFLVGKGGFACLRAGRSAALMRRRRIIHFRSPSNPPDEKKKPSHLTVQRFSLVGEGGFEPPKSLTTDLQSAPFGHSGIPPYVILLLVGGAGRRIRTPDLLITNQLLYQLSYTSISATNRLYLSRLYPVCQDEVLKKRRKILVSEKKAACGALRCVAACGLLALRAGDIPRRAGVVPERTDRVRGLLCAVCARGAQTV